MTQEELAAQRAEAEAGIATLEQRKQPTKVSQKKVDQVKVGSTPLILQCPSHTSLACCLTNAF
jgi:hypothetical protein